MLLEVITILIFSITILGYTRLFWWCTVLDFFRLHYAVLAFLFAGLCVAYGAPVWAALNLAVGGMNLYRMRKFMPFKSASKNCKNKDIFSINAYKKNITPDKLEAIIEEADAQVLLMMETTEELEGKLSGALQRYPYSLKTPVRDGFNIHLLSKNIMEETDIHFCTEGDTPLLCAKINLNGQKYQLYSAHPKPAFNKEWKEDREAYFDEMKEITNKAELPVIILGDFNSVPWETHFINFLNGTDLKSTLDGHGYRITWPAFFPLLGVPMDHILISKSVEFSDLCVGPFSGSDHFPISINLK